MNWWRILSLRQDNDPDFGKYLLRASENGPRTLAVSELIAAAVWGLLHWGAAATAILAVLAAITALSHIYGRGRNVESAGISAACGCFTLAWFGAADWEYGFAFTALLLSAAVSSVPLRPLHLLAIGIVAELLMALRVTAETASNYPANAISAAALFGLAAYISGVNYTARRSEFEAGREAVRVAEALGGAQLRAQLAENAVSIGKMAAALTHELNSPLGALRSSIGTLLNIMRRQEEPGAKNEQIDGIREQLRRSIDDSAARIEDVMSSMQRLISLGESETQSANLNELLEDVALLHRDELQSSRIDLELDLDRDLPRLTCRPQLLLNVFSSLLSNAIQAVGGNGRIWISSRRAGDEAEVTIRDNGRGMDSGQVETIFEPSLRAEGGRISSSNWSLFNSRQVIYEHGGEIRVDTAPGEGTSFHVTLPVT
jgi:signal transduction histidine kinase